MPAGAARSRPVRGTGCDHGARRRSRGHEVQSRDPAGPARCPHGQQLAGLCQRLRAPQRLRAAQCGRRRLPGSRDADRQHAEPGHQSRAAGRRLSRSLLVAVPAGHHAGRERSGHDAVCHAVERRAVHERAYTLRDVPGADVVLRPHRVERWLHRGPSEVVRPACRCRAGSRLVAGLEPHDAVWRRRPARQPERHVPGVLQPGEVQQHERLDQQQPGFWQRAGRFFERIRGARTHADVAVPGIRRRGYFPQRELPLRQQLDVRRHLPAAAASEPAVAL